MRFQGGQCYQGRESWTKKKRKQNSETYRQTVKHFSSVRKP